MAGLVTTSRFHFPDPNDGKTPKSYGLNFRWVEFPSPDGVPLKGWYIPAEGKARGTIVYAHGHNRTRVEMLPEAAFARGLGYNGLPFDLRHQGRSGGNVSTVGYSERLDLVGAVRYVLDVEKADRPVILWGVSMGAAASLLAAAECPEVDAVVSDSSFLSFSDTVKHHFRMFFGLPSFPIADEIIYCTAYRGHFHASDFDLVKAVERIGERPVLFIGVAGDRRMPPNIARELYAHCASPHRALAILPGTRHGEGFKDAPQDYQQAVRQFLARVASEPNAQEVSHGYRVTGDQTGPAPKP